MPAASASGAMVAKMLARQDFGGRHEGGLPAGFDHLRRRNQRHHGFAGADVAMQQAQHALGLRQVGNDFGDGAVLRRCQRIGQLREDAPAQPAFRRSGASGAGAHMGAQQSERELACQQFIVSEPRPGGAVRSEVFGRGGAMQRVQRLAKARIVVASQPRRVLPFRQHRQPLERCADRLADLVRMQALGQRIDRINQRQFGKARCVDHAVGMQHLQVAVVERCGAGDVAHLPFGQELLEVIRRALK